MTYQQLLLEIPSGLVLTDQEHLRAAREVES
jgi:hypothetical protein